MGGSQPQVFSVRIVSVDYYMAPPVPDLDISYSPFHGGKVNEVPVIRIYGSTPAGQKTCLHIHRVLPYLYVPCSNLGPITNDEVNSHKHSITLALEKALKLKGNAGSKRQHVHGCDVVRARKFYGYHSSEELFVKIYLILLEYSNSLLQLCSHVIFDIIKMSIQAGYLINPAISGLTSISSILKLSMIDLDNRYYPHDVSRAADILLTGAILDKTLQPYESHIPFLLQFLIDYNLYGMGLLHVSKVRFRYPVPDVFSQRKVKHQGNTRPVANDSTCMSSQADVVDDLCLNTPIWTSSTIPDGWIWQSSAEPDSSTNRDIPLFRRQSTSELEADAAVHDIINQQHISYASLSQTHSDVKMVQSLIPIWEEEYERNGVPEAMPLDSEKPLPQDVLRILADGIGFENLMEVSNEAENWPLLTPESIKSSDVCGDLVDSEMAIVENSNALPSKYLKASDMIGPLLSSDSPFQNVDAAGTNDIDSVDQLQISGTIKPSIAKDTDEDALRLLKWLASSQAEEDINSDDELAREMILSPLPLKDIDKMLEIANVDYESESQKECQDILDTIDMLNIEESNDRVFLPVERNHSRKCSSNKTIPQLDGSSDDLRSIFCLDKPLKADKSEATSKVEGQSWPELDSNLIGNKTKRPRWGSLPVSHQQASEVLPHDTLCILNGHDDERNEGLGTSCLGDETKKVPVVKVNEQNDVGDMKSASAIGECSTRDLMRRKRSHRIGLLECMNQAEDCKAESCPDADCRKGDIGSDSKLVNDNGNPKDLLSHMYTPPIKNQETKFHGKDINSISGMCSESVHAKQTCTCSATTGELPPSSSKENLEAENLPKNGDSCCDCVEYQSSLHVNSCKLEHASVLKTKIVGEDSCSRMLQTGAHCISESGCQTSTSMWQLPVVPDKHLNMEFESSPCHERYPSLSVPCDTPDNVNKESESMKLIGMTFSVKPPTIDWTDESEREASAIQGFNVGTSLGDIADNCLPFFVRNSTEEENQGDSFKQCKYIGNKEPVMGVPTLYQNDGSYLFMLTPVVSPPLRESVERWLSSDSSDILRQKITMTSPFLPVSTEFSGDMVDSQSSQTDHSNSPLPESSYLSDENPNIGQVADDIKIHCSNEVKTINETKRKLLSSCSGDTSQLSGPDKNTRSTPLSQIGFRDPASAGQGQQLTLMSIEVNAESRGDLRPDPRYDSINIIVLVLQEDDESTLDTHVLLRCGSFYVEKDLDAVPQSRVFAFTEELQLLEHFTKIVRVSDPDVLMGWDVQSGSIGFLAERAAHLGVGLLNNISRTPSQLNVAPGDSKFSEKETGKVFSESVNVEAVQLESTVIEDEWGRTHASGVHVGGRIVLNVWRLMRNEVKLNMYTFEAVAEAVLRRKIPHIPWKVLTRWFSSGPGRARYRCIDYTLERAKLGLQIMSQLDMINRTSELARVFGIEFFSVLSRGSQYRVESMFLRLAHTQNYLAISPGKQQVANQPAMECLPLVMEPESNFYADPVIVLDFQSLYPSMVIAYNLCFCTCLGKITFPQENTLGVSSYSPDLNDLCNLKRELLMTPNGVVYVPSKVRKGILPRLLEEILSTRIMVKQAMKKLAPSQLVLRRILNARQLALKLIANVTYGYTAAGFSGRMPCAELADSIVQCGRRTLEAAISFVNSNDKWKAKVIYGDTDSMFVLLKGRSLKEAFAVGREIASAITEMNPSPIALKMEKVYLPCFLLTKKRYVGYSYESPDQSKPIFDAKGIETVRRDTCASVSKMMEQSLRTYFESQDIHMVKEYILRQWTRILSGRFSLQDFVFAKEVRLGTYAAGSTCSLPPAAIVATKSLRSDPRSEPRYAERIPYVVVHGEPGARLVDMVVDPLEVLAINSPFRLNDIYYIRKQIIPALQRVFGLVGADLNQWFLDMPRPARESIGKRNTFVSNPQRMRIDYYYASKHCVLCGDLVQGSAHLCLSCSKDEATVAAALTGRSWKLEKDMQHLAAICRHCGGGDWLIEGGVKCNSLACSVFYERIKVQKELMSISEVATRTGFYPKCMVEWF